MDIRILLGQRKVSYPGQYAPEVMEAWDEYCLDDNWEGWEAAKAARIAEWGDDLEATAEIVVDIPDHEIDEAFQPRRVGASIRGNSHGTDS